MPAGVAPIVLGDGFGFGPAVGIPITFGPDTVASPPGSVLWPFTLATGDQLRLQAVVLEPGSPIGVMATNTVRFSFFPVCPPVGALVEAIGTDSYNAIATSGFWKVTNQTALDFITRVEFSWLGSSNPAQATMVFDYDQAAMADRFDGGNSLVVGCRGTYRNSSDVTAGLIYDNATAFNPTTTPVPCDPTANCGWTTTSALTGSVKDIAFRFAPGVFGQNVVFEFDADTDGGAGLTGGAMAGMVVTITWQSGCLTQAELQADPANVNRSFVNL